MDMKRYEQITSEEALEIMAKQGWVFDINERQYSIQDREFKVKDKYVVDALMGMSLNEFLAKEWYVKKPFDVRAEMLDRPNEWVGAFKNSNGEWMMIGFNENKFGVSVRFLEIPILYSPNDGSSGGYGVTEKILDNCIPFDDVPEEELT